MHQPGAVMRALVLASLLHTTSGLNTSARAPPNFDFHLGEWSFVGNFDRITNQTYTGLDGQLSSWNRTNVPGWVDTSGGVAMVRPSNTTIDLVALNSTFSPATANALTLPFSGRDSYGVNAGIFYGTNGTTFAIYGGHFVAQAGDGSSITNLLIQTSYEYANGTYMDDYTDLNGRITGLPPAVSPGSTFLALYTSYVNSALYAGGQLAGSINNNSISGIIAYNLTTATLPSEQPASLDEDSTVYTITSPIVGDPDLYVGGDFSSAGTLTCPSVCVLSPSSNKWRRPGHGLNGTVTAMIWASTVSLIIGGNFSLHGQPMNLATYYLPDNMWMPFSVDVEVPGHVTAFAQPDVSGNDSLAMSDNSALWVAGRDSINGSAYLTFYNGTAWHSLSYLFGDNTSILGLSILFLRNPDNTIAPGPFQLSNNALIVTGRLNISGYGMASAATFDGTVLAPYLLTSTSDGRPGSIVQLINAGSLGGGPIIPSNWPAIQIAIAVIAAIVAIPVIGESVEWYRRRKGEYAKLASGLNR